MHTFLFNGAGNIKTSWNYWYDLPCVSHSHISTVHTLHLCIYLELGSFTLPVIHKSRCFLSEIAVAISSTETKWRSAFHSDWLTLIGFKGPCKVQCRFVVDIYLMLMVIIMTMCAYTLALVRLIMYFGHLFCLRLPYYMDEEGNSCSKPVLVKTYNGNSLKKL